MSKNKGLEVASTLMRGDCLFYLYSVGYHSYEDSEYTQYAHEKKLTKDELLASVHESLLEVMRGLAGKHSDDGFQDSLYVGENGPHIQHLFGERLFKEAMEARGFQTVDYAATISMFGWASAMDPEDWDGANKETAEWLKAKCEEEGIFVESFKYDRDAKSTAEIASESKLSDDEKKEVERMLKTYYRLGKK